MIQLLQLLQASQTLFRCILVANEDEWGLLNVAFFCYLYEMKKIDILSGSRSELDVKIDNWVKQHPNAKETKVDNSGNGITGYHCIITYYDNSY